jgi:hypothetical protein
MQRRAPARVFPVDMPIATVIVKLAVAAQLLSAPTFVVQAGQPGDLLYLEVSNSRQVDANGVFTHRVWSRNVDGGVRVRVTPRRSRIWRSRTQYWWHVYRVDCPFTGPRPHTCTERAITPTRLASRARRAASRPHA